MSKTNYLQELMGIIETACQDAIDYGEETWLVILANSHSLLAIIRLPPSGIPPP